MKILFTSLLNSVDKDIKDTLYKNKRFLEDRWGYWERNIVLWSSNYTKYVLLTLSMFLLVSVLVYFILPYISDYFINIYPKWDGISDWQTTFLSSQLTIVGVVYPLVIGLVSIVFQNKSEKKAIFPIFQIYSGFMFAGLSGLMLSGFIVLGYLIEPYIPKNAYSAICASSSLWMLFNIFLTAWFFVQTFRIMDDSFRERIILRYTILELCEIDVRERIKGILIERPLSINLIKIYESELLEVKTYLYEDKSSRYPQVVCNVGNNQSIKNINYTLINLAIRLQTAILRKKNISGAILAFSPNFSDGSCNIAKYKGFNINPLVEIFIKNAFSFSKTDHLKSLRLSNIVNSFVGAAYDSLKEDNSKEFSECIEGVIISHSGIASVLSFYDDNGALDNWMVLPSTTFLGRSYLDEFITEYYQLTRLSIDKIDINTKFFLDVLHLYRAIYSKREDLVSTEVHALLRGSYDCWFMLMEWRADNKSVSARLESNYEDLLKEFVGHWESWSYQISPEDIKPTSYDVNFLASTCHMEFTLMMMVSALRNDNTSALEWCIDMLNHWPSAFNLENNSYIHYRWKTLVLNPNYLKMKQSEKAWNLVINGEDYCQESAIYICFENFNLDLRLLAVTQLIQYSLNDDTYCSDLVLKLLKGEMIHKTGCIESSASIENAVMVLESFIRQQDYGNHNDNSYSSRLTSVLRRIERDNAEPMVSGRTYMSSERNNLSNLSKYYVQICVNLSSKKWYLSRDLKSTLLSEFFTYKDRESIIRDLKDWVELSDNLDTSILYSDDDFDELILNFKYSLSEIIKEIEEYQIKSVIDAEIDEEILASYSKAASNVFCDDFEYPLSLFNLQVVDVLPKEALKIIRWVNVPKSRLSKGIVTNRPINDGEFQSHVVSNKVALQILNKIFNSDFIYHFSYTSVLRALEDISVMIDSVNKPVMFVSSHEILKMLRKAKYNANVLPQLDIHFEDKDCNAYVCHIGSCKVYELNAPSDECLLLSLGAFDKIKVQKLAEDQFVDASFIVNEDDQTIGTIEFRYSMEIGLIQSSSLRHMRFEIHPTYCANT
ncbi:hypothetical protein GLP21_01050 [Photobacterium carnosum]|uniref:hypothetical protein n=1 Tax=Photobacterium carnosum TaxID=2023717 RepID=UPI001E61E96B|nr:hypothetical protein [Photobacterium carnosum]MCD9547264.1 hypothetical protein [Photobacterium carnosum]MCF2304478.1 hypothetical protein [Photobacterium carnosum]